MKKFLLIAITVVAVYSSYGQRTDGDSTKKTVVITSAYKPVLKPAAKINFSAATIATDTSRPSLTYKVPAQNLFFSYQPASLKPLALSLDSSFTWENSNFVKLGFGNYSSPFAQAGLSLGNGKTSVVNLHAKHISQKGSIPFQQYSRTNADLIGIFSTGTNTEWSGKIGIDRNTQYYYGFQPDTLKYSKDSLRQRFNTLSGKVGLRNKEVNSYGISYAPNLSLNFFNDNRKGKEMNIVLDAPLSKTFNEGIGMNLGFTADITRYNTWHSPETINNNLFFITPAVTFKKSTFTLNGGITPSWDNKELHLLPNITALVKVADADFVLQGGWIGYYRKNTFQSLAAFNPWIEQPASLLNTRINESFFGFKGSAGSHFTYNAKLAHQRLRNQALFVNDVIDGKTFKTVYEPDMKNLQIHGEVGYTFQERFSLLSGATINRYTGLSENSKAWGLLPVEVNGSLRWQVLKDLQFKSDLFFWDGPRYVTKELQTARLKGAFDLNAGVEFTVVPRLNIWLQLNNVLNNKYERWNQYQVLGFNVLGGIVYSFSKSAK